MRTLKGIVSSNKQDKTIVATVHTYKKHPKYKKKYRSSKKYHIHNPNNKKFNIGDEITFYESTPISKFKKWTTEPKQSEGSAPTKKA
jgi:small subunit ribosomal protein S17